MACGLSIVIPTYNERDNLSILIPHIEAVLEQHQIIGEIVIVDDNSPDGCGQLADDFAKIYGNIKVVHREKKEGVGSARQVGSSAASYPIILNMEGDNSHNPDYIPQFVERINQGADIVIGSRYIKGAKIINWPLKRMLISKLANIVARMTSGANARDLNSGYRAFTKEIFEKLKIQSSRFSYNMEFACEASNRGFRIEEVPIIFVHRINGTSKMRIGHECMGFIYTALKFSILYRPLAILGGLGFTLLLVGLMLGIEAAYLRVFNDTEHRLALGLAAIFIVFTGGQMISLGVIASLLKKRCQDWLSP